jgi:hypothetical protein
MISTRGWRGWIRQATGPCVLHRTWVHPCSHSTHFTLHEIPYIPPPIWVSYRLCVSHTALHKNVRTFHTLPVSTQVVCMCPYPSFQRPNLLRTSHYIPQCVGCILTSESPLALHSRAFGQNGTITCTVRDASERIQVLYSTLIHWAIDLWDRIGSGMWE